MPLNVIELIDASYAAFSKGQKRIADFVKNNYSEAAYMTAARLGAVTNVSEPTVVRFACTLGYDGYPEFQRDLNNYAKTRLTAVQRIEVAKKLVGDEEDVISRILSSDAESVRKTAGMVSRADFGSAVDALMTARTIYVVGVRSAYALACFLDCYLSMIFPNVRLINDRTASGVFEQLFAAGPEDTMVAISFPRYSQSTVKAAAFAHKRGARVIALTDGVQSPLVQYSNFNLFSKSDIMSYYDSLVGPLSVIDALLAELSLRKKDEVDKTLHDIEEIFRENDIYEKTDDEEI